MSNKKNNPSNDSHYDTRLALLEQSISHINETLLRFEKRFDSLDSKMDSIDKKFESKFDKLESKFEKLDTRVDSNFKWLLSFMVGGFGSLLGIMAHGFHWL